MQKHFAKRTIQRLEEMLTCDQEDIKKHRAGLIDASQLRGRNSKRVRFLTNILKQNGFPTITATSKKAYLSAILIVLHSENITLLRKSLTFLEQTEKKGAQKKHVAFIFDKLMVSLKKPQRYGTQYKISNRGKVTFANIDDPKNLNRRRRSLGLGSFDVYKRRAEKQAAKFFHSL